MIAVSIFLTTTGGGTPAAFLGPIGLVLIFTGIIQATSGGGRTGEAAAEQRRRFWRHFAIGCLILLVLAGIGVGLCVAALNSSSY